MSKKKKAMTSRASKRAPIQAAATGSFEPIVPEVRIPHLLEVAEISSPRVEDRWIQAVKFGGAGVERVAGVLAQAETGWQYESQDLYEWMLETDPHIASVYETRLVGLASLKWDVEPASDKDDPDGAHRAADFVRECLNNIPGFRRSLHELADGIGKGYAVQEIMWGRQDQAWRPTDLRWRHQRRFMFGPDWDLRLHDLGIYGPWGKPLPPAKYVVHIPKQRAGYPTRTAAMRSIAFHWVFKRWAQKFWLTGAERFGMPTPLAKVPQNTTKDKMVKLRDALDRLTQGQSGIVSDQILLEFIPSSAVNTTIYQDLVAELNNDITKALLGSASNVDAQANGSRAASESQAAVTIDPRIAYDADALEGTINEQLVKYIIDFNWHVFGGKRPPTPRFKFLLSEDTKTPIFGYHLQGRLVTRNEVRRNLGLDPLEGPIGDELLDIVQGGDPAAVAASSAPVGEPTARPLASMSLPKASLTPQTLSRFAMSPLGRALSKPSGGPQS